MPIMEPPHQREVLKATQLSDGTTHITYVDDINYVTPLPTDPSEYHQDGCRCVGAPCPYQAPSEYPAIRALEQAVFPIWKQNVVGNRRYMAALSAQREEEERIARDKRDLEETLQALRLTAEKKAKEQAAHEHAEAMRAHAERIRNLHHFVYVWEIGVTELLTQLDASVANNTSYLVGDVWDSGNGLYKVVERRWINNALNIGVEKLEEL